MLKPRLVVACVGLVVAATAYAQQPSPTLQDGRYAQAGMTFQVPTTWDYVGTGNAQPPGAATAHWRDPQTGANLYAWMSPERALEDLAMQLANAVPNKTQQRERQGYRQWRVRPESVRQTLVDGRQALSAIADFTSSGSGEARVELLTWILAPDSRMLFFAFASPEQLESFKPAFDEVVRSARLP